MQSAGQSQAKATSTPSPATTKAEDNSASDGTATSKQHANGTQHDTTQPSSDDKPSEPPSEQQSEVNKLLQAAGVKRSDEASTDESPRKLPKLQHGE